MAAKTPPVSAKNLARTIYGSGICLFIVLAVSVSYTYLGENNPSQPRYRGIVLTLLLATALLLTAILVAAVRRATRMTSYKQRVLQENDRVFERISDAFVALDTDWRYTYVNQKAGEVFNRDPREMIGRHIWTEFPEGVGQPFQKVYEEAMITQEYRYLEEYYAPYDRWFENHIYPSETGLSIYFRDITARKRMEVALKESEEKFRTLIEQASDGIFIADAEGRFLLVNESGQRLSQYSAEELSRMTIYDVAVPADLAANPFRFSDLAKGDTVVTERPIRRRDGTTVEMEITSKLLPDRRMLVVARDITRRRSTERDLRMAYQRLFYHLNNSPLAIIEWDRSLVIQQWSARAEKMFGWSAGEVIGKRFDEFRLVHEGDAESVAITARELTSGSVARKHSINRNYTRDGRIIHCEWYNSVLKNDAGEIESILSLVNNITDRVVAETELRAIKESLEDAERNAGLGSWQIDVIKKKGWWSKHHYSMFGFPMENEIPALDEYLDRIHPEDRPFVQEAYRRMIEGHEPENLVFRTNPDRLHLKYFRPSYVRRTNEAGQTIRFEGTVLDVTREITAARELERQKELADSVINSLPGIFYLYDENGKFIRWNKNFEIVSGYDAAEISRMHPLDFFDADTRELLHQRISQVFSEGSADVEASFFTKGGSKIPYYFNGWRFQFEGRTCLLGIGIEITKRVEAERALRQAKDELREFASRLESMREEERKTISREIHDELGQQLTGLKIDAIWLRKNGTSEKQFMTKIDRMVDLIDDTVRSVRRIATQLRPGILDDLGLVAALEWHASEFRKWSGIATSFHTSVSQLDVTPDIATGVFRIYQETLTNIARHANPTEVKADLSVLNKHLRLAVSDDGRGFDTSASRDDKTLGLTGMRERAIAMRGEIELNSEIGKGTTLILTVPLEK